MRLGMLRFLKCTGSEIIYEKKRKKPVGVMLAGFHCFLKSVFKKRNGLAFRLSRWWRGTGSESETLSFLY